MTRSLFPCERVLTWSSSIGGVAFMSYASLAVLAVSTGIPILFIYGKRIRSWTSGSVSKRAAIKSPEPWGQA